MIWWKCCRPLFCLAIKYVILPDDDVVDHLGPNAHRIELERILCFTVDSTRFPENNGLKWRVKMAITIAWSQSHRITDKTDGDGWEIFRPMYSIRWKPLFIIPAKWKLSILFSAIKPKQWTIYSNRMLFLEMWWPYWQWRCCCRRCHKNLDRMAHRCVVWDQPNAFLLGPV